MVLSEYSHFHKKFKNLLCSLPGKSVLCIPQRPFIKTALYCNCS